VVNDPLVSFVFGILPSLFWLFFFLLEDRKKPEPKKMISKVFMAGAILAGVAAFAQIYLRTFTINYFPEYSFGSLAIFAFIEELAKFLAVYLLVYRTKFFDEPIDGMIYMITAAMGFAALENIIFLFGTTAIIQTTILRFVGATLLHAMASAILGFYLSNKKLLLGFILATLLHTIFNFTILNIPGSELSSILLLVIAGFFVFNNLNIEKSRKL